MVLIPFNLELADHEPMLRETEHSVRDFWSFAPPDDADPLEIPVDLALEDAVQSL